MHIEISISSMYEEAWKIKHFIYIISLRFISILEGTYYQYSYFTDEKTET